MPQTKFFKSTMQNFFLAVAVLVFTIGLTIYSSASNRQIKDAEGVPARAFTLTLIESVVDAGGTETVRALRIQDVDEGGNWTQISRSIGKSGEVKTVRSSDSLSTQSIQSGAKVSQPLPPEGMELRKKMRTAAFYESHPQFAGTDNIVGLKVYRIRYPVTKGEWLEMAYSPVTGDVPLHLVNHNPDGSEVRIEAVKINLK